MQPRKERVRARLSALLIGAFLLVPGWLLVLVANRWQLGVPTVMLLLGWLSVVLVGWYLWTAAASLVDTPEVGDEFFRPEGAQEQLEVEKKALLKAIKEIEFDHQMRKLSDSDAAELTHYYRVRAIEILKMLDAQSQGQSISEQIDREIRARVAVHSVARKARDEGDSSIPSDNKVSQ